MSANLTNMNSVGPKLQRYVLNKVNTILCQESATPDIKESTDGKKREVTIEHILSQNFSDEDLPENSNAEDRILLEKNIWRLGNLTLLERVSNSAAGNKSVKQKFDENAFRDSSIVISRLIQVKNFSGKAAAGKKITSKHNTVLNKYKIEIVSLDNDKYFGLNQIEKRRYLFSILSSFWC